MTPESLRAAIADLGIEALPDPNYGDGYRCSTILTDGTVLPCVIIREATPLVDLAQRRIAEESRGTGMFARHANPGREMLSSFVTQGNRINSYDIARIEPSPCAIPSALLLQIRGETAMSLTAFALETKDGRAFSYSTSFHLAFFELPPGVSFSDFVRVHNHSVVDDQGGIVSVHHSAPDRAVLFQKDRKSYRERPYFECFLRAA